MLDDFDHFRRQFAGDTTLDATIDHAHDAMRMIGFEALIYDYTPVRADPQGEVVIPSLLKLRNVPDDMHEYWCERGYFRCDPVQIVATRSSAPFFWDYDPSADTAIGTLLDDRTEPVARYLRERDMSMGVTVPIHLPHGGYATVTGVRFGRPRDFARAALRNVADFGLLAHVFHEHAWALIDARLKGVAALKLTERERECLRHSAHGLSAKEISRLIERSVPTVVMHLNSAMKKLGARNRTQAVVRAARYGLLEADPL